MNNEFIQNIHDVEYTHDIAEYVSFLKSQNLILSDDPLSRHSKEKASHYISRVGIQRFHSYYIPFHDLLRDGNPNNIGLDDVLCLYKFDRRLRLLVLDAIERIEVATKTYICSELEEHYGKHYLNQSLEFLPKNLVFGIASNIERIPWNTNFRDVELLQIIETADSASIAEAMTLGQASKIYEKLPVKLKIRVSRKFGVNYEIFEKWLRRLTLVRNASAHHSRLWNFVHGDAIKVPGVITTKLGVKKIPNRAQKKFYSSALIIHHCLQRVARRTKWHQKLYEIMNAKDLSPEGIHLATQMGFPDEWHQANFWNSAGNSRI